MAAETLRRDVFELHRFSSHIDELYEQAQGEVTDEVESWEEFVKQDSARVLEALAEFDLECKAAREAGKVEMERLKERDARLQRRQEWAREKMRDVLQMNGVRKMEAGTKTVSLRAGPERVVEEPSADPSFLPEEMVRVVPERVEPDKNAIKVALKSGAKVYGYHLERGPESVVVK